MTSDTALGGHNALFEILRAQNTGENRHIFIVQDRFTLSAEKEICERLYPNGTVNIDVCGFAWLARKTLGRNSRATLTREGAILVLNKAIRELGDRLKYYARLTSVAFAREMYSTLSLIRSNGIKCKDLREKTATLEDGSLKDKLSDIILIYEKYEEEITGKYYDSVTRLDRLIDTLDENEVVRNSHLYLLGFVDYTNAQLDFAIKAAGLCPSVSLAFLSGIGNANCELYDETRRAALCRECRARGIEVNEIRDKRVLSRPFGFLHANMFARGGARSEAEPGNRVRICGYENIYEEVKCVAREIRRLATRENYRYKEIAVVLNDPGLNGILAEAFERFEIPSHIDERHELMRGFFASLALKILDSVDSGFERKRVLSVLRHPYSGFDRDEIQAFENYALKYNVNYGRFMRPFDKYGDFGAMEKIRARLAELLAFFPRRASVSEYCEKISDFSMKDFFKATEERFGAGSGKERIYADKSKFLRTIGEIKSLGGVERVDAGEFVETLKELLRDMTIGDLPLYDDVVFAGNTTDSRFKAKRVLFAIGANDGYFPIVGGSAAFGSWEAERLEKEGLRIYPTERDNDRAERLAVVDLLSKTDRLYVSYSKIDHDGARIAEGAGVSEIRYRLGLKDKPFEEYYEFDANERLAYRLGTARNCLFEYMAGRLPDECLDGARDFLIERGLLRPSERAEEAEESLLKGYAKTPKGEYRMSVSKMEGYFRCPYFNFLSNSLGLRERETGELRLDGKGIIIHAALEKYFSKKGELRAMSESARDEYARKCIDETVFAPEYASFMDNAVARAELMGIRDECVGILKTLTENMLNSAFTPECLEKRFGSGREIAIERDGKKFVFGGIVDRVDSLGNDIIVMDYKTGARDDDLAGVYSGRKIQLYLYLKYFMDRGRTPCGVFYVSIRDGYAKEANRYAMRGQIIDRPGMAEMLDRRLIGSEVGPIASDSLGFGLKRLENGEISISPARNVLSEEDFRAVCEYVMRLCGRAITEIASGEKSRKPHKGACRFCMYKAICGEVAERESVNVDMASFRDSEGEDDAVER